MRTTLAFSLALAVAAPAQADSLGPPPTDCPEGARGRTARVGTWCEPTTCGSGAQTCPTEPFCAQAFRRPCPSPEPWRCSDAPIGLCVRTQTRTYRNRLMPGSESSEAIEVTNGPCEPDGACREGFTCERARRCVHEPARAEAPAQPGDGPALSADEGEREVVAAVEGTPADDRDPRVEDHAAATTAVAGSGCVCGVSRARGTPAEATLGAGIALLALGSRLRARRRRRRAPGRLD